jgi:hypothetical protein
MQGHTKIKFAIKMFVNDELRIVGEISSGLFGCNTLAFSWVKPTENLPELLSTCASRSRSKGLSITHDVGRTFSCCLNKIGMRVFIFSVDCIQILNCSVILQSAVLSGSFIGLILN